MANNTIDIQKISNQLNYLKETKTQIQQALMDKGQVIDESRPFRDYVENIDKLGSIKKYNTVDELNADTMVDADTIGLVYKDELLKPESFDTIISGGVYLPKHIKLNASCTTILRRVMGDQYDN